MTLDYMAPREHAMERKQDIENKCYRHDLFCVFSCFIDSAGDVYVCSGYLCSKVITKRPLSQEKRSCFWLTAAIVHTQ